MASTGYFPNSEIKSRSPALQADSLLPEPPEKLKYKLLMPISDQIRSVAQSCLTPWITARQASLSITNS